MAVSYAGIAKSGSHIIVTWISESGRDKQAGWGLQKLLRSYFVSFMTKRTKLQSKLQKPTKQTSPLFGEILNTEAHFCDTFTGILSNSKCTVSKALPVITSFWIHFFYLDSQHICIQLGFEYCQSINHVR